MPTNRISVLVAIGLLAILLASPALGQGPLGFQLFAPADVSTFGGAIEPNEGYFFQFDGLYWAVSAPETSPVGLAPPVDRLVWYSPTLQIPQYSTLDTSQINTQFSAGTRFEFGRVENQNGWFMSIYKLHDQEYNYNIDSADIVFDDGLTGGTPGKKWLQGPVVAGGADLDLPVTIYDIQMSHSSSTWGVELMYLRRMLTRHAGGTFEFFAGARYLQFKDTFSIQAGDDPGGTVDSFLANSYWQSAADNNVVGPQVGLRWFKKQGRWMLSTEGRFLAGLNCQNIRQQINLGPNLNPGSGAVFQPASMGPNASTYDAFARVWAPGVELRIEARYQITRTISFHAGWTGLWMDGIARGSSLINYEVPAMGIDLTNNRENLFMNGLTLGFDINR